MPAATFGGERLHPSLFEQAAAYLFHLVKDPRSSTATSVSGWRAA
jgi:hypothetical protein